ncbi:MAG: putative metal-binding motif-containing protein [Nannocystaceae bacterium]|nr:hypothetical protein [bacterium]
MGSWGNSKASGLVLAIVALTIGCADPPRAISPGQQDTETGGPIAEGQTDTDEPSDTTGGDTDGSNSDTSDTEDTAGDETGGTGAPAGDPCTSSEDCAGYCWNPKEEREGICVDECAPECPEAHYCDDVAIDGMTVEVCLPTPQTFCDTCETNADCGGTDDLCVPLDGGRYCTISCAGNPDICPAGFGCGLIGDVGDGDPLLQCVPDNGICCIDGDGDIYGEGGGCFDVDCDDTNPAVHTQAEEVCDGLDNDCDGNVDNEVTDCAEASCSLGKLGYFEQPGESCVEGECVGDPNALCDLYTCAGGDEEGDLCATDCGDEDDSLCVPPAHCDDSECVPDVPDGQACDELSDCESDYCGNDFCCAFGDCCQVAEDCPTFGTEDPICISPATCQGTRGEAVCGANFICSNTGVIDDDSACGAATEASDCGFYPSVMCTGEIDQYPPECPDSCVSDEGCDLDAFCNPANNECEGDLTDGNACDDDSWCISGHCQNGFCCDSGDCCSDENDCPGTYSSDPVCTSPASCQGERDVALCNANICETAEGIADDSACDVGTQASDCGPYPALFCTGGSVQDPPECADGCTADAECDADAYCTMAGVCVPDEPDGETCDGDQQCISGHCQNGFCCDSGDCCADSGDCSAYDEAPVCDSSATCQGTRVDGVCSATSQCETDTVDDDSGCATIEADDCGPYPALLCGPGQNQTPPVCADDCSGDAECDASAHCDGNVCVPDEGPGGSCTSTAQCQGGLSCVDGVCCTSSCVGTCEACDVPGSEGTCTDIPNGDDLDNECGAIDCDDYFSGWVGDVCYDRADVPANEAACNGAGACQVAADLCGSQPQGSPVETCHASCQSPDGSTCSGQTDPVCDDVNPGTNTCGQGVCQNTMDQCQNGAPLACEPNNSALGPETCNNLDDNCDGSTDNGPFSDGFEPNGSCAAFAALAQVGSNQTVTYNTQTIYGAGDNDYYYFHVEETDSSCECCNFFCTDEDYRIWVWLTVPPGAGSYFLCANSSCGGVNSNCTEVLAGQTGSRVFTRDGGCPGNDDFDYYVRVYGDNAPAYECLPYTLQYRMEPGCY